jgi:hypothetical protein
VYSSVVVGQGAYVRDCRVIRWMWVMCRVGIVDYSVSGEHGGDRGSGVKGREGRGENGERRE